MAEFKIKRTTASDPDFYELVKQLDAHLIVTYGEDHSFYDQFNKLNTINHVVVLYENEVPLACGAIKHYDPETAEVKRMFTKEGSRGKGMAGKVLSELESWAIELSYKRCILETSVNQPEAIQLYKKSDYKRTPNYGQYAGVEKSFCFEKLLQARQI